MKSKELLIACAIALVSPGPANAGGADLSAFGTPVDPNVPVVPLPATRNESTNKRWPAHICAEIQRVEGIAVGGPLRPSDRGIARFGLLLLEQGHCGIDVSRKVAADQAVREGAANRVGRLQVADRDERGERDRCEDEAEVRHERLAAQADHQHTEARGDELAIVSECCPFGETAQQYPHVVCALDRGMIRGMLAGLYGETSPHFEASRPEGAEHCVARV